MCTCLLTGCIVRLCGWCGDGATDVRATRVLHIGNKSDSLMVLKISQFAERLSVENCCNMFWGFRIVPECGSSSDGPPLIRAARLEHVGGMSNCTML